MKLYGPIVFAIITVWLCLIDRAFIATILAWVVAFLMGISVLLRSGRGPDVDD